MNFRALALIILAPQMSAAQVRSEHSDIVSDFRDIREECYITEGKNESCEKMLSMIETLEEAGICYPDEGTPHYCETRTSAPVAEGKWHHAKAPMMQFEGYYESRDKKITVSYGCAGLGTYSNIQFSAKLENASAGESHLLIDGSEVSRFMTEYDANFQTLTFENSARYDSEGTQKADHNHLVDGLANGRTAVWVTPDGVELPINLEGSKNIGACRFN